MKTTGQNLRRWAVLILAVLCSAASAQTVGWHDDNELCGHTDSATVCDSDCHPAISPSTATTIQVQHHKTERVHAVNDAIRDLLLPNDIFRPPPTNS